MNISKNNSEEYYTNIENKFELSKNLYIRNFKIIGIIGSGEFRDVYCVNINPLSEILTNKNISHNTKYALKISISTSEFK